MFATVQKKKIDKQEWLNRQKIDSKFSLVQSYEACTEQKNRMSL